MSETKRRLPLVSNSTQHGGGYLDHCAAEIKDLLAPVREVPAARLTLELARF